VSIAPSRTSRMALAFSGVEAVAFADRSLAIAPDGARVVYIGNNRTQMFVRPLDRLDPTAIFTAATPLNFLFVSPDGQWVGFIEGTGLRKIAIAGGPAFTIVDTGLGGPQGATWAPDGTIIAANNDATVGLMRVSANGEVTTITRPAPERGELDHLWPEMLPGGRAVLFTITATTGGMEAAQVAVLNFATGAQTVVVRGGSDAHYLPSGHLAYTAGGTLRAIAFDLDRLEARGASAEVLPHVVSGAQGGGNFDVAADGTLAYVNAPAASPGRTLVWVDRQGKEEPLPVPPRPYFQPRVSPDGKRVAVATGDQENDIWIWDLARQTLSRLTFGRSEDFFPVWTADGSHLIFSFGGGVNKPSMFSQPADGTGRAEPIGTGLPTAVTPDGKRVIYSIGGRDLMMMTLDQTHRVEPLVQTPANERNGIVSPDGRWLAYESDNSGPFEVYVRPFPDTGGQWLLSAAGGFRPVWAPNGRELFYEAPGGAIMVVQIDAVGGVWKTAGNPAKIVDGRYVTSGGSIRNFDVSADGKRLLMVKEAAAGPGSTPQIVVVQNWTEELKRLAPVVP
jgi:dipeptidyl aminopeptidase/acylaminoacyl peptidase